MSSVAELPFTSPGLVFAVLVLAVLVAPHIARWLRVPEIVVLLLLGMLVGPTGLGFLERTGAVALLGGAGLLFLMFIAGLELDLDRFLEHRRDSAIFGMVTFLIPMSVGTVTALALGFELLPALLLASCWASHTLLTYPVFQRVGTVGNRAVATSVGATIVTDSLALLVLAVVARAYGGALSPSFWLTLLIGGALLVVASLFGLPRLTRFWFAGPGQDAASRFLFVLAVLFVIASLASTVGIEAIVGAFLAGLALNRNVPNGGQLMERLDFFGRTLLIPFFLLATGMLVDVRLLTDPAVVTVGVSFTLVATGSKLAAALLAGRALRYEKAEIGAMFALSNAQAAATLAAVIIGLEIGLIDQPTVNAVVLVILVTCMVASAVAARVAPRLGRPEASRSYGSSIVMPVANPSTVRELTRVASLFAQEDGGVLVPVSVVPVDSDEIQIAEARRLHAQAIAIAQSFGAEATPLLRIDSSPEAGIRHTYVEREGTLIVLGWKGGRSSRAAWFGSIIDRVIATTPAPVLVLREGTAPFRRVLIVIDSTVAANPAGRRGLLLALKAGTLISRSGGMPIHVVADRDDPELLAEVRSHVGAEIAIDRRRRSIVVKTTAGDDDFIIVPTMANSMVLSGETTRTVRSAPQGASLLLAIDNGEGQASAQVASAHM